MNPIDGPINLLYMTLSVLVIGFGVGIIVWQTGATRLALATRTGFLFAGVVLILLAGAVLTTQIVAYFVGP